jgi:hypothetical protein
MKYDEWFAYISENEILNLIPPTCDLSWVTERLTFHTYYEGLVESASKPFKRIFIKGMVEIFFDNDDPYNHIISGVRRTSEGDESSSHLDFTDRSDLIWRLPTSVDNTSVSAEDDYIRYGDGPVPLARSYPYYFHVIEARQMLELLEIPLSDFDAFVNATEEDRKCQGQEQRNAVAKIFEHAIGLISDKSAVNEELEDTIKVDREAHPEALRNHELVIGMLTLLLAESNPKEFIKHRNGNDKFLPNPGTESSGIVGELLAQEYRVLGKSKLAELIGKGLKSVYEKSDKMDEYKIRMKNSLQD